MIISRTKRAFEVKWKTIFLVSQVLSFRREKQTSKNVAETTFKIVLFSSLFSKASFISWIFTFTLSLLLSLLLICFICPNDTCLKNNNFVNLQFCLYTCLILSTFSVWLLDTAYKNFQGKNAFYRKVVILSYYLKK